MNITMDHALIVGAVALLLLLVFWHNTKGEVQICFSTDGIVVILVPLFEVSKHSESEVDGHLPTIQHPP